jgi:hypothetical protein
MPTCCHPFLFLRAAAAASASTSVGCHTAEANARRACAHAWTRNSQGTALSSTRIIKDFGDRARERAMNYGIVVFFSTSILYTRVFRMDIFDCFKYPHLTF